MLESSEVFDVLLPTIRLHLSLPTIQRASPDHVEMQNLGLQVGALSGGLAGGLWSPDGNLLCLVSLQGQLLLMNKVCTPHASGTLARVLLRSNILLHRPGWQGT